MIVLTVTLEVNGKAKAIQIDSLTPGDFAMGPAFINAEYFEKISDLVMEAYRQLSEQANQAHFDMVDERDSISRRLAKIGMV